MEIDDICLSFEIFEGDVVLLFVCKYFEIVMSSGSKIRVYVGFGLGSGTKNPIFGSSRHITSILKYSFTFALLIYLGMLLVIRRKHLTILLFAKLQILLIAIVKKYLQLSLH